MSQVMMPAHELFHRRHRWNSAEFRWVHCNDECNIMYVHWTFVIPMKMYYTIRTHRLCCCTIGNFSTCTHTPENTLIHRQTKATPTTKYCTLLFLKPFFFLVSFIQHFFVVLCSIFGFSQLNEKKFHFSTRCRSSKLNHICLSNDLAARKDKRYECWAKYYGHTKSKEHWKGAACSNYTWSKYRQFVRWDCEMTVSVWMPCEWCNMLSRNHSKSILWVFLLHFLIAVEFSLCCSTHLYWISSDSSYRFQWNCHSDIASVFCRCFCQFKVTKTNSFQDKFHKKGISNRWNPKLSSFWWKG